MLYVLFIYLVHKTMLRPQMLPTNCCLQQTKVTYTNYKNLSIYLSLSLYIIYTVSPKSPKFVHNLKTKRDSKRIILMCLLLIKNYFQANEILLPVPQIEDFWVQLKNFKWEPNRVKSYVKGLIQSNIQLYKLEV